MPRQIATFPDQPSFIQTVTLDGTRFRLRLTWRERLLGWYMDLYELDETPVAVGRRLSPGHGPLLGMAPPENGPEGAFIVTGPDPYSRSQLGSDVLLLYVEAAELEAINVATDTGIRVDL